MYVIQEDLDHIPGSFQAPIEHRCQLQRIKSDKENKKKKSDAQIWVENWQKSCKGAIAHRPLTKDSAQFQTRTYQFDWRFVTNGGQDDHIIRPVIGARGLPYYPGSSMKGAFRSVCTPEQVARYCGREDNDPAEIPLRFLGGYPTNTDWHERLLDLTHPQQKWQVETKDTDRKPGGESAFAMLSLYRPKIAFGISVPQGYTVDWQEIWEIWDRAVAQGLGCRVSAGYGQAHLPSQLKEPRTPLYEVQLDGQGYASTLLDDTPEFRPNIFRAALRGHALRLFGGLTDNQNAHKLVAQLFGDATDQTPTVGLLRTCWKTQSCSLDKDKSAQEHKAWQSRNHKPKDTKKVNLHYSITGTLSWYLTQSNLPRTQQQDLQKLLKALTQFAMLLGGFGKSWRRPDHDYIGWYDRNKKNIGCHWEFQTSSLVANHPVWELEDVGDFLNDVQNIARRWMQSQGIQTQGNLANFREAWRPDKVQVWGRNVPEEEKFLAVEWLHQPYKGGDSIYKSALTGFVGKDAQGKKGTRIGRLWYRVCPVFEQVGNQVEETDDYWELLTLFPDDSESTRNFLRFLATNSSHGFTKLWGD